MKRITKQFEKELGETFKKQYPHLGQLLDDDEKSSQFFTTADDVEKKIGELNEFHAEVKKQQVTANPKFPCSFPFFVCSATTLM